MKRHLFAIVLITAALVAAPIQNVLSFQGKLVEGGVPVDGTRNITFKIYNVATGGVFLWQESHVAVPVVGGLFNVELGGTTPFAGAGLNFDEQYWVGVSVGGGAEISPRYKLTNTAYSMSPWTINAGNIYRETGNVGIGTNSPAHKLHVEQLDEGHGIYGFSGAISNNNFGVVGAQNFSTCWGGLGGYSPESYDVGVYGAQGTGNFAGYFLGNVFVSGQMTISGGSPGVGKVLTSNAIGFATWETPSGGSNWTLSGGNVYRTTGRVGIGNSSPNSRLHIDSDVTEDPLRVRVGSNTKLMVNQNGGVSVGANTTPPSNGMYISGNVGIGATTAGAKLHIKGDDYPNSFLFIESSAGNDAGIRLYEGGTEKWHIFLEGSTDNLEFRRQGFGLSMLLQQTNGYVGIGTGTPSAPLDVVGSRVFVGGGEKAEILSVNNTIESSNSTAIYARCENTPGYGTGGIFNGAKEGINARGYAEGSGYRYGVRADATGGSMNNYGVYATASNGLGSANGVYAVYAWASGSASTHYSIYCNGDGGYTGSWSNISDIKFKKNVRSMEGILDKIMMLQPKTFEMRTDEFPYMNLNEGTQYGLIAQELIEVFPELVSQGHHPGNENHEGAVDYTQVDYIPLTAILVRAIQEQQTQIEELKAENNEFRTRIEALEKN